MQSQKEQDRLWHHFQLRQTEVFDLSYPRLRFFAGSCRRGEHVLNVGIGNGFLERQLLLRGIQVRTLDPSRAALRQARRSLGTGFQGKQGYLEAIPYSDGEFDRVICTEVFEHLHPEQFRVSLGEIWRILKAGGILIGSVPYREKLAESWTVCPRCEHSFHRWGHRQGEFDRARMTGMLRAAGFGVGRCYPRTFVDYRRTGLRPFFRALFRRLLGLMGEAIVGPSLVFEAVKMGSAGSSGPQSFRRQRTARNRGVGARSERK